MDGTLNRKCLCGHEEDSLEHRVRHCPLHADLRIGCRPDVADVGSVPAHLATFGFISMLDAEVSFHDAVAKAQ
eukprot:6323802-Karenia_brevis.AAC.1